MRMGKLRRWRGILSCLRLRQWALHRSCDFCSDYSPSNCYGRYLTGYLSHRQKGWNLSLCLTQNWLSHSIIIPPCRLWSGQHSSFAVPWEWPMLTCPAYSFSCISICHDPTHHSRPCSDPTISTRTSLLPPAGRKLSVPSSSSVTIRELVENLLSQL